MAGPGVVVVGGGPCGLTAALMAARHGHAVTLLEGSHRPGGMAASPVISGQRVDLGSHRLHPSASPAVEALLDELLGADLQVRTRNGRLRLRDRWIPFPFTAAQLLTSVPPGFAVAAARDVVAGPWRRPRADSYAEVVRAGLGPTVLADFHGPMAHKLWGTEAGDLAGDLARRRLPIRTPRSLAGKILRRQGTMFRYPRLGYGQIVDRLVDECARAGVDLRLGTRVAGVVPDDDEPVVSLESGEKLPARRVFWTGPPQTLAASSGSTCPDGAGVAHRGLVLAYLVVPQPRYSPFDAHYVPDPGVAFSRLSEPKNYRDGPDPTDHTVLCAELPATPRGPLWRADPRRVLDLVLDGLARCGLEQPVVDDIVIERLGSVYPVVLHGSSDRRRQILDMVDRLAGVTMLGRQGLLVADNLHHVMDMALSATACLGTDGGWDSRRWANERQRFDSFVVDD